MQVTVSGWPVWRLMNDHVRGVTGVAELTAWAGTTVVTELPLLQGVGSLISEVMTRWFESAGRVMTARPFAFQLVGMRFPPA
jgi:hypothetical protein